MEKTGVDLEDGEHAQSHASRPQAKGNPNQETERANPTNSGISDMTQAPAAMQQLATMLMTAKQPEVPPTGPALQEWMATFAVAVQQARRDGEQNPQARALLASLLSLASVESPAVVQPPGGGLQGGASGGQGSTEGGVARKIGIQRVEERVPLPNSNLGASTEGAETVGKSAEKRQLQPSGGGERPRKLARTSTMPNSDTLELTKRGGSGGCLMINRPEQSPWSGVPHANLVQHNSNPEPRRMAMGGYSQAREGGSRPSTQQFRVYTNAFQEPLPMPRWAATKAAREKPREEVSGNLGSESNRRPQLIVTGSSRSKTDGGVAAEPAAWSGPAPGTGWGEAWKSEPHAPQPMAAKTLQESRGSGIPTDPNPSAPRHHNEAANAPKHLPSLPVVPPTEGAAHGSFQGSMHSSSSHQDLPRHPRNNMEAQLAAAWLNQRYNTLGQALSYSEANINTLMNTDSNALAQVLDRLQAAQQLQGAAAAQGGLPAAAALLPLMQLQQLAQSIGSSTGLDAVHLHHLAQQPHHSQSEASPGSFALPFFGAGRPSLMQPPSLGAPSFDQELMQEWNNAQLAGGASSHRGSYGGVEATHNNAPTVQQPLAMRPAVDYLGSSGVPQHSKTLADGLFADPRASPFYTGPSTLPPNSMSRGPQVYLPTELSMSMNSNSDPASQAEMTSIPSLDSTMTRPTTVDLNNPFEVHREQAAHALPTEEAHMHGGFVKISPQRPKALRIEPRGSTAAGPGRTKAAKRQGRDMREPGKVRPKGRSPSPQKDSTRRGRPQGDEELAAETLLNLFGPGPKSQERREDSPSQLRRPIKKRFRSRG